MRKQLFAVLFLLGISFLSAQPISLDTVKAYPMDTGKMWTFDAPPVEYLKETYGFEPEKEWFEDVRLSALRFGGGCTGSFVSEDGLIMTNHHCGEWTINLIENEGEDFSKTGFWANTLEEERKVPRLTVQQLVLMKDITPEIQNTLNKGNNEEEKMNLLNEKIEELEKQYSDETGLRCRVTSFYNGGKYSIYGYKVYDDIRLVFIPEPNIGYFGGDYDNFTYPRYAMDCAYFRAYENDEPVKVENYFEFSLEGLQENEPIFTVGNPGSTRRLKTIKQIEFMRDITYRNTFFLYDGYYKIAEKLQNKFPEKFDEYEIIKARLGNGQKVYKGRMEGLFDEYLMARKLAWENDLKEKIKENEQLNSKYGHAWDKIAEIREKLSVIDQKIAAFNQRSYFSSVYYNIAKQVVNYAEQMKLAPNKRDEKYNEENLEETLASVFPESIDEDLEFEKLAMQVDYIFMNLGFDNRFVNNLFGSKYGPDAARNLIAKTKMKSRDEVEALFDSTPDEILSADDPFIKFIVRFSDELEELQEESKSLKDAEFVFENMVGRMMYEVHGTSIPPDANGTMRLSDGMLKGFDYNGTYAPVKTTFYGMYDRFNSYDGKYPWDLPAIWQYPPSDFDKSVEFNFVSTNDIVGGNSGSAVINKEGKVVGLAFDGNFKSNIGNIIYLPHENRCVSVSALGMLEALEHIYKANRLVEELKNSKIN